MNKNLRLRSALAGPVIALWMATGAGASDWQRYGLGYDNQRFSNLAQINRDNVADLQPAWSVHTGRVGSFQATPIVRDGVMYVSTAWNDVLALDALSGKQLWRYVHEPTTTDTCCGPANRGVGVDEERVYLTTIDARVIALDRASGAVVWDIPLIDPDSGVAEALSAITGVAELDGAAATGHTGYSANMAPQIIDGLVLAGITGAGYGLHVEVEENGQTMLSVAGLGGGDHGLRGFLVALDASTGEERWRWHSAEGPGWEGDYVERVDGDVPLNRDIDTERARADRYRDAWRLGGGSIWTTPAVDVERRMVFIGTGNPAPQMDDATRPGDNLYTVSLVALSLDTGKRIWHYQQVPHDRWGYDVASPPVLFSLPVGGQMRKVVGQAAKTGWFYIHDRFTGKLLKKTEPFAPQENLFARPTAEGVRIAPSTYGACSWSPVSVDEANRRVYIAGTHQPAMYYSRTLPPDPDRPWSSYTFFKPVAGEGHGLLSALDLISGELRWQLETEEPLVGGVLATAGGLVFNGEGNGRFAAYDADSGRLLWQHRATAGVNAPAITYSVGGVQYIAVAAGGNSLYGYTTGDEIIAFRLPE
jgi:alcohol dehydrogenase (cytochrome c)